MVISSTGSSHECAAGWTRTRPCDSIWTRTRSPSIVILRSEPVIWTGIVYYKLICTICCCESAESNRSCECRHSTTIREYLDTSPLEHWSIARTRRTSSRRSDIAHRPYRRCTDTGTDGLVRSITTRIGRWGSIDLSYRSTGWICRSCRSTNRYCCPPRIVGHIRIDHSVRRDQAATRGGSRIIPPIERISSTSWIRWESSYCCATGYRFRSWCVSSS